jgi:hypothetical protein
LRVGLGNLSRLESRVQESLRDPFYVELSKGSAPKAAMQPIFDLLAQEADPTLAGVNRFDQAEITGQQDRTADGDHRYEVGRYQEKEYTWYEPGDPAAYWTFVQQTLRPTANAEAANKALNKGVPTPAAELRQVPAR